VPQASTNRVGSLESTPHIVSVWLSLDQLSVAQKKPNTVYVAAIHNWGHAHLATEKSKKNMAIFIN